MELCLGDISSLGAADNGALTPEELAVRGQQRDLALAVLAGLPTERASVLVLHDVGELSTAEIASRLKVNPNTAKSRLLRARRDVRAVVQEMRLSDGDVECPPPSPRAVTVLRSSP